MKSPSNFRLFLAVLGITSLLSTAVSWYAFGGIEDGIIQGSSGNTALFAVIDQAKYKTIGTNLVGILFIAVMWFRSLLNCNARN